MDAKDAKDKLNEKGNAGKEKVGAFMDESLHSVMLLLY